MIKSFSSIKKILISICITSLCVFFSTSCLLDALLGDSNNTENQNQTHPDYGGDGNPPIFDGEHTDPNDMKNLVMRLDFDNYNSYQYRLGHANIIKDAVHEKWFNSYRPYEALKDNHKNVCQLQIGYRDSFIEFNVNTTEPSCLTFQYRPNTFVSSLLNVTINNTNYVISDKPERNGIQTCWLKVLPLPLKVGNNTVKIKLNAVGYGNSYYPGTFYIDNITVAPDKIEFVDIYPKGLQELRIGDSIDFDAIPLRGDRSKIDNQSISYSISGGGNIDRSTGKFTPQREGSYTLTAYVNGKAYEKKNIYVHGRDYLLDPVKIGNYQFNGNHRVYNWEDWKPRRDSQNRPYSQEVSKFSTDGFFVLKGYTEQPLWIKVIKQVDNKEYETIYYIREKGNFEKRIWLRFGRGEYKVQILDTSSRFNISNPGNGYGGDITNISGYILKELKIQNTSSISLEDAMCLMPSEVVQNDNYLLSNLAHSIAADLPASASVADYLRSIHDVVIRHLHYDTVSVNHPNQRKRQDAYYTWKYQMGVCEGYANLFAALARSLGIKTKVMADFAQAPGSKSPERHAWNQVNYKGSWYLVDATWDDPVFNGSDDDKEKYPLAENYTFFMTAPTEQYHYNEGEFLTRSMTTVNEDGIVSFNLEEGYY